MQTDRQADITDMTDMTALRTAGSRLTGDCDKRMPIEIQGPIHFLSGLPLYHTKQALTSGVAKEIEQQRRLVNQPTRSMVSAQVKVRRSVMVISSAPTITVAA